MMFSVERNCEEWILKMGYEVQISYYENGIIQTTSFLKDVSTLDELKASFLKRFGNISDASNKALKEKAIVKELTYSAKSLPEWIRLINTHTRWELNVKRI